MQEELIKEKNRLNEMIKEKESKMLDEMKKQLEIEKSKMQAEMEKKTEEKLYNIERMEEYKREADEILEKNRKKVEQKIRKGKILVDNGPVKKNSRENMQRDNNRIYWAFRKGNIYQEYFDESSVLIEKAFKQGRPSVFIRNRGTIDFLTWHEKRETGEEIQIKRVNSMMGTAKWQYWSGSE